MTAVAQNGVDSPDALPSLEIPVDVTEPVAAASVAPTAAPPSPPKHPAQVGQLTREELLEIENLSLKVQNVGLQEQRLQQDLIQANKMRNEFQSKLSEMHKELSQKYGLDLMAQTTQITPEGVILDMSKLPKNAPGRQMIPQPGTPAPHRRVG